MDLFTPYSSFLKYNPNHDERGRFTSGPSSGSAKTKTKKDTASRSVSDAINSFLSAKSSIGSDAYVQYGSGLINFLTRTKISKEQWHRIAKLTDTPVTRSWSGVKVKSKVLGRIRFLLDVEHKSRSRDGRSAG